MLRLEQAFFGYNKNNMLIANFSYTFQAGGHYLLCGKNGTGKSTLMQILAGDLKLKSGKLMSEAKSFAYIPQQFKLANSMVYTVQEFVTNMLEIVKRKKCHASSTLQQNCLELVEELGLSALLKQNVANLSNGEQQKLVLLRAILSQADLYLFDEAWSALDEATINKLPAIFAKYLPEQACLLQISHGHTNLWSKYTKLSFPLAITKTSFDKEHKEVTRD